MVVKKSSLSREWFLFGVFDSRPGIAVPGAVLDGFDPHAMDVAGSFGGGGRDGPRHTLGRFRAWNRCSAYGQILNLDRDGAAPP
jgi:hypothetical protein